ncbi:MAG: hypothetical protein WKF61_00400 [Luteimonas sp.]
MKGKGTGTRGLVSDPSRLSRWLGFLIDSQRWRGVTQTKVAAAAKTKPCNLSAFITSDGLTRNVGEQRLMDSFNFVGVHLDGLLTAGLHRWDLGALCLQDVLAFNEIIKLNPPVDAGRPPRLFRVGGDQCFFLHRPTQLATVMARLPAKHASPVTQALGIAVDDVDECAASELQSLWLTPQAWVVNRAIDTYLGLPELVH